MLVITLIPNFLITSAQDIDILYGVKIELRDGVQLNATIYKPHEQKEALPVICTMTPYINDTYHERGTYFAANGYVFASIDVRGRGSSDGTFEPFTQEANDGYDIVEWLAKQPYCNSKVAMWGGSYAGYNQWATTKKLPPHLKTIVPAASVRPGLDFPISNGIGCSYAIQWFTSVSGKIGNDNLFQDYYFWKSKYTERYEKDIAFNKFDSLVGNPDKNFKKFTAHSFMDNYFKNMSPNEKEYNQMNIPVLTITGCYDSDQPGALSYYREFMTNAPLSAKNNSYLIIGPWDHGGTRTPRKELGGLTFGDAALLNMNDLHKQWYDHILKDSVKPMFLQNKVAYYVTNTDKWKYAASLKEIGKTTDTFYLNSANSTQNDIMHSAFLQPDAPENKTIPATYVYNPLDKRLGAIELNWSVLTNQTMAYDIKNDGVIYHSAQFENETEVSGFFELKAYIQTDVKDVDIVANVYEIKLDGSSVFLTSNAIRARYRESLETEKLLLPGEINLFDFKDFSFISRVIEKGSRLRLLITSPNSIQIQKNYCSGGIVADESAKDAHIAHVKIYNDSNHPSILIMPFVNN